MPRVVSPDVVCIPPRKWEITENKWEIILSEWKKTGLCVRPMKIKEMFPEDFKKYELIIEDWP